MSGSGIKKDRWLRITVPTTQYYEDVVASFLVELSETGVEFSNDGVTAYLPLDDNLSSKLRELEIFLRKLMKDNKDQQTLEWFGKIVYEEDWSESWKAYFRPVRVGKKIVISPSWEEYIPGDEEIVIRIDPGQAFGVGTHPTTRMCIEWIEIFASKKGRTEKKEWTLCDLGCGTGILSVVAAKLGAKKVVAVDIDPVAVEVTRTNCVKNEVESKINIIHGSLDKVSQKFSCVVANLTGKLLTELAPYIKSVLFPGSWLILSGILDSEIASIENTYQKLGYRSVGKSTDKEWGLLVYTLGTDRNTDCGKEIEYVFERR